MKAPVAVPSTSKRLSVIRQRSPITIRVIACFFVVVGLGVLCWLQVRILSHFSFDNLQQQVGDEPQVKSTRTTTASSLSSRPKAEAASSMAGKTKIITFTDHSFRFVAANWYERLKALGYTTQTIVAVDEVTVDFLANHTNYRYDVKFRPPLPSKYDGEIYRVKRRLVVTQIFALRWRYILQQLKQGIHVLLTDCDNIFSSYVPLSEFEQSEYDVFHAYETKHPGIVFAKQGFCVCGGMSWFRASPKVIHFIQHVVANCKDLCDDQDILNRVILYNLNMTWDHTPDTFGPTAKRTSNNTDERFNGLLEIGVSGTSGLTGHRVKIWDRDFAFRGTLDPPTCPRNNWVSMPMFSGHVRQKIWMDKLKSFDLWDKRCGHVNNRSFGIHYLPEGFNIQYNKRPEDTKLDR